MGSPGHSSAAPGGDSWAAAPPTPHASRGMDQSARSAVLVRVQGPDPKGTKRNDQSFSLFDAGITTLSASGTILPLGEKLVVVTSANVVRPFLTKKNKCEPTALQ